jgi:hypothetical protein
LKGTQSQPWRAQAKTTNPGGFTDALASELSAMVQQFTSVRLEAAVASEDVVYGVTTGFGALADTVVPRENAGALQHALVRHFARFDAGWREIGFHAQAPSSLYEQYVGLFQELLGGIAIERDEATVHAPPRRWQG